VVEEHGVITHTVTGKVLGDLELPFPKLYCPRRIGIEGLFVMVDMFTDD
jgi:hypothetical protein